MIEKTNANELFSKDDKEDNINTKTNINNNEKNANTYSPTLIKNYEHASNYLDNDKTKIYDPEPETRIYTHIPTLLDNFGDDDSFTMSKNEESINDINNGNEKIGSKNKNKSTKKNNKIKTKVVILRTGNQHESKEEKKRNKNIK